ncbi:MAG: hypothetical protein IJI98_02455 [Methanosphaera sp.]|uniref:THUMP domain-containing protein n=1 Tax=Methanosphaera sp. ISO3-F5 TaxID=1452353 RepID=UPI002B25DFC5|nr:THUMP domain-containing protein [Methanosphaera sp. ISO3-F5]MBR0471541.1 hypothetical protein [Methanosphaera sp.]WQH64990.1 THUMP domain-containing protein [Methanosphaera sp. ISO3-F5]
MKLKKQNNKELLIKFKQTPNPKELDDMLTQFENNMNKKHHKYFLKESENPFIYFLEYSKPEELMKELEIKEEYKITPVTCVMSNMNYITATILRKIRHKICYQDTFKVNCYINSYTTPETKEKIEEELTARLKNLMHLEKDLIKPVWTIEIYIVGDITGINIISKKQNRTNDKIWT